MAPVGAQVAVKVAAKEVVKVAAKVEKLECLAAILVVVLLVAQPAHSKPFPLSSFRERESSYHYELLAVSPREVVVPMVAGAIVVWPAEGHLVVALLEQCWPGPFYRKLNHWKAVTQANVANMRGQVDVIRCCCAVVRKMCLHCPMPQN